MTKHHRPTPEVTRLETHGPDRTVIARMERRTGVVRDPDETVWVLTLFPESSHAMGNMPGLVWQRDGNYATKATTVEEARSVLDYATHAVLTYLERVEDASSTLIAGLDKASAMAAQQTLPLED